MSEARRQSTLSLMGYGDTIEDLEAIGVFRLDQGVALESWVREDRAFVLEAFPIFQRLLGTAVECQRVLSASQSPESLDVLVETQGHVVVLVSVAWAGVAMVFAKDTPLGLARATARQIVLQIGAELPREEPPNEDEHGPETPRAGELSPILMAQAAPTNRGIPATPDRAPSNVLARSKAIQPRLEFDDDLFGRPALRSAVSGEWPAVTSAPVADSDVGAAARRALEFATSRARDRHVILIRIALRTGLGLHALAHLDQLGSQNLALLETAVEDMFGVDRGYLRELRESPQRPDAKSP